MHKMASFFNHTFLSIFLMCFFCINAFGSQQVYYSDMSSLTGWTESSAATNEAGETTGGIRVVSGDVQFNSWWDSANWMELYRSVGYTISANKDYTLTVNMMSYASSAAVDIKLINVTDSWANIATNTTAPSTSAFTNYTVSFTTAGGMNSGTVGYTLGISVSPGWWNNMVVADVTVTESEPGEPTPAESYSIDLTTQYQTFDGLGVGTIFMQQHLTDGSPAYELPNTYQKLFGDVDHNYHMIWLRADVEATNDNSDPCDVDLTNFTFSDVHSDYVTVLSQSAAHNPNIKFAAEILSPPAWLKTNSSTVGNGTIDTTVTNAYKEFAEFIFGNLLWYKQQGISFDVLNMMNEPDWTHTEIDGVTYTAAQAKDMIKAVIPHLQTLINSSENTESVTMPSIMMPSTLSTSNVNSYVNALKTDGTAWGYVDMISTHHYGAGTTATFQAVYDNIAGKPFVMNEWHSANDGTPSADIIEVMEQADSIITTMNGGVESYWWFESNHPTNTVAGLCLQDWGVAAEFGQTYDSWRQWANLTPIGGSRVAVTKAGSGSQLSYIAVDDSANDVVVLTVLNQNASDQYIGISVANESVNLIQHNKTTATESFSPDSFIVPSFPSGETVIAVEGQSLNTFEIYYETSDSTAPSAPANLATDTGNGEVALEWNDNSENDLAGYNVSRSTTSGSGYTEIASGLVYSEYVDTSATAGTIYYYVVTAMDNSANESSNSSEAASADCVYFSDMSSLTGWVQDSEASNEAGDDTGGVRLDDEWVQMNSWWDTANWMTISRDLGDTIAVNKSYTMVVEIVSFVADTPVSLKLKNVTDTTDIATNSFNPLTTDWGEYEVSFSTAGGQNSGSVGDELGIMVDAGWWNNIFVTNVKVLEESDSSADTSPPTPNPATFATAPYATSSSSIAMVATTGTDGSGPVQYYFDCTAGGGSDSGWQTSASYTDTGLSASTQYTYTVQMRDSLSNTGTASSGASATTDAPADTDPPTPNPASFATAPYATSSSSIAMVATTGSDASGPVEYYFACTAGGGNDSGWQTSTSYTDTGLSASTQYTYTVQMRDSLSNTGTASSGASATTDAASGPVVVFTDNFESATDWTNKWSAYGAWNRVTARKHDGAYSAEIDGSVVDSALVSTSIDVTGKSSATVTFWWLIERGLDVGEYIAFDTDTGSGWVQKAIIRGNVDPETAWLNKSVIVDVSGTNSMQIRFRGKMSGSNEDAYVDQVEVSAE